MEYSYKADDTVNLMHVGIPVPGQDFRPPNSIIYLGISSGSSKWFPNLRLRSPLGFAYEVSLCLLGGRDAGNLPADAQAGKTTRLSPDIPELGKVGQKKWSLVRLERHGFWHCQKLLGDEIFLVEKKFLD